VDYSSYEEQIRRLVDKQVIGNEVKEPEGVYVVNELGRELAEEWSEEKTRNETDLIRTRARKTIEQDLVGDPYAQKVFSELLKEAIAEAEALFDHPLKQYALFKTFEEKLESRQVEGIPESLNGNRHARAWYGAMRLIMGDDHSRALVDEALVIDRIVDQAVAEHSLNQQGLEAAIRKGLLPGLFKLAGMDKAREIIESVIQITRVGISRGEYR
jgi:type I restriction enzyme R subunit